MAVLTAIRRAIELMPAPLAYEMLRVRVDRLIHAPSDHGCADPRGRRLFIDVTMINKNDAGTGIQRVVRALARDTKQIEAGGWNVWYVVASRKKPYHRIDWSDPGTDYGQSPIEANPGDVFLGLDYALDVVRFHEKQLKSLKKHGAQLWFLVHDLLPAQRPDWFSRPNVARYGKWLRVLASLADGFFCNSAQTEAELVSALGKRYGLLRGYRTRVLPMGTDIESSLHTTGLPTDFERLLKRLARRPTIMMVGTLEPRKGHEDALNAFDLIWRDGKEVNLLVVGRQGWKVEQLVDRIDSHPLCGYQLHWLSDVSDEALMRLYDRCDGVLLASLAEGFGLPLTEALRYRKPVLARDLPVFHRPVSAGIRYFPASASAEQLAESIQDWLQAVEVGAIDVDPGADLDWADSVKAMLFALENSRPPTDRTD